MDPQMVAKEDVSRKQKEECGCAVDTEEVEVVGKNRGVVVKKEENETRMEKTKVSSDVGRAAKCRADGEPLYIDHHPTTQRFNELQDRLGFDQPSKLLGWLMDVAALVSPSHQHQHQHHSLLEQDAYSNPTLSTGLEKIDQLQSQELLKDQLKANQLLWPSELGSCASNSILDEGTPANSLPSQELPRDPVKEEPLDLSLSLWVPETGSSTSYSINVNETLADRIPGDVAQVSPQEESFSLLPEIECISSDSVKGKKMELPWNWSSAFHSCKRQCPQKINPIGHLSAGVGVYGECLNCLLYCGIFPKDYEIDNDTFIQLWMAAGFIMNEPMEDVASNYLQMLECENVISYLRKDPSSGKKWYKINHFSLPEEMSSGMSHVRLDAGNPNPSSITQGKPIHVTVQHSSFDFEVLRNFTEMRTLLFLHRHGSCFKHLPDNFFISLKHLETLDLSETRLLELSTSISNAECLRYLDLSHTLIKQLPETIGCLCSLQTLKLCKCSRLIALPIGITKLNRLRHLEFDIPCSTCFMPPGMGGLTSLRTLLEFPAGADYGCTVQELKNLNDLSGSLCLSRLENIESLDEAGETNLCSKQWLKKLELRWSPKKRRNTGSDDDIITYLRPHINLQDLRILCYGGSAFPTWISDPSFVSLVNITLFKCENCLLLPDLGLLPSLESLSLYELTALRVIDFHYGQDIATDDVHNVAFPRLQKLEMISMINLEDMRDPEKCDFPCLVEMTIKDCPKLATLGKLSGFPSLNYLEINYCQRLPSLPGDDLSVETLVIEGCPLLGSSCSKDGQDWHKIVHIPNVFIDKLDMPSSNS